MAAVVNLDFDARVPIPFSIFPSSYRSDVAAKPTHLTETHVEGEIHLPHRQERVGREGLEEDVRSSHSHNLPPPPRRQEYLLEEEVRVHREEEDDRRSQFRPSRKEEEVYIHEEREVRRPEHKQKHHSASFDLNTPHHHRHFEASIERDSDRHHKHTEVDIELPHRQHKHHRRPSSEVDLQFVRERERQPRQYQRTEVSEHHSHHSNHSNHSRQSQLQKSPQESEIDFVERQYRSRFSPSFKEESVTDVTVDPPSRSHSRVSAPRYIEETHRVTETTIDPPSHHSPTRSSFSSKPKSVYREEIIDEVRVKEPRHHHSHSEDIRASEIEEVVKTSPPAPKSSTGSAFEPIKLDMGYYDDEGNYHSLRGSYKEGRRTRGFQDRIDFLDLAGAPAAPKATPNTVTIPCHHIRMGDLLMLQGRPCQVIRITTSSATGQHRYLGVDLFTRSLQEESSFIANPSPSVVVQTMLGPVFKQYRVLDVQDHSVVAMTENGDVKQNLPVLDQSNLFNRIKEAFEGGRGSVRIMVVQDGGREIAVDLKVVHGSRL